MNNKQIPLLPVGLKCYRCDEPITDETEAIKYTSMVNAPMLCRDCYGDYYYTCDECGDVYDQGDETTTTEAHTYCEGCVNGGACFWCDRCETYYDGEDYYNAPNGLVCQDCYDSYYFSCASCGNVYSTDDAYSCDYCDNTYCEACIGSCGCNSDEIDEVEPEGVHRGKTGKYLTVDRLIGVEIEAEEGTRSDIDLPENVGIHEDGSLDSTGVECVTPPASLDEAEKYITKTCKALSDAGYTGTSACGLHVHIDVRDIRKDIKKICRLVRTVYAIEDILFSTLPPSRQDNTYCVSIRKNYNFRDFLTFRNYSLDTNWYKSYDRSEIERRKGSKHDGTRYHGLNVHSIFYRGTIEFRYHSGTVSPLKILYWSELLLKIVDYSVNRYIDADIVALNDIPCDANKFDRVCDLLELPAIVRLYFRKRIQRFRPFFFSRGTTTARRDLPSGDDASYKREIVGL